MGCRSYSRISSHDYARAKAELGEDRGSLVPVPWLDERFGFYAIPGTFSLSQSNSFRHGRIYGMDVSSGAAVAALLSDQDTPANARVLDLCCSPGLKLCMIADLLSAGSTVIGVDISEQRLSVCKRIVKKYHVDPSTSGYDESERARIRFYCADGTTFGSKPGPNLVFDSFIAMEDQKVAGKRRRMNKSARARERKRLKQLSFLDVQSSSTAPEQDDQASIAVEPFDYVLVDAECSTDGSLKHVQQRALKSCTNDNSTADVGNTTLTDPKQLQSLVELQKGLILSGFRLLKQGGVMIYSTCSLSTDQNESVVKWLLETCKDAVLVPVEFSLAKGNLIVTGSLKGTVRFLPGAAIATNGGHDTTLFGGGFFLAKIGKQGAA